MTDPVGRADRTRTSDVGAPSEGRLGDAARAEIRGATRAVDDASVAREAGRVRVASGDGVEGVRTVADLEGPRADGRRVIGRVYHLEGTLNGERVQYTGATAQELRDRLTRGHAWDQLIRDPNTRITAYEVTADPRADLSNRGTIRSATNEALRAVEELHRVRASADPARELNRVRAALPENVTRWIERHSVTMGEGQAVSRGSLRLNGFAALGVLDAAMLARDLNIERQGFVMAPHVFHDEGGAFTVSRRQGPLAGLWGNEYHKEYFEGARSGQRQAIDAEAYRSYRREGDALYGYLDLFGNFQPGLLRRTLPVVLDPRTSA